MAAPLEYVIIEFPENNFTGQIAPELAALVESKVIRLIDVVLVSKGDDGSILAIEVDEADGLSAFLEIEGEVGGVISPEDIDHAAASIMAGSSVLMIVWEDTWAERLVGAISAAGGELVEGGRIPAALASELAELLASAS